MSFSKKDEDRIREIISEKVSQALAKEQARDYTPRVERLICDEIALKVGHQEKVTQELVRQAEEARELMATYKQTAAAAEGQLKDLRVEITDAKRTRDDIGVELANLAARRDELAKEVATLESQFKDLSAGIADKKIARIR